MVRYRIVRFATFPGHARAEPLEAKTQNMNRTYLLTLLLILMMRSAVHADPAVSDASAEATVRRFYEHYLGDRSSGLAHGSLIYSSAFHAEISANVLACQRYSTGVCGWGGVSKDVYLDTQESAPDLNYENSGLTVKTIDPGIIQVKLNVYPSNKQAGDFYEKTITYRMIEEDGAWVVDDIFYKDGISIRRKMADENEVIKAHPDPDAPGTSAL